MIKRSYTLALLLLSVSCSSVAPSGEVSPLQRIEVSVEYVDDQYQTTGVAVENFILVFPHISGQLYGSPDHEPLLVVKNQTEFVIDLQRIQNRVAQEAARLRRSEMNHNLSIDNPRARLTRIATFSFYADSEEGIGGSGFLEPTSREGMILMYVDRPCHISGSLRNQGIRYIHDIQFQSAGFHWIRMHKVSENEYRWLAEKPTRKVIFFIIHPDLQPV